MRSAHAATTTRALVLSVALAALAPAVGAVSAQARGRAHTHAARTHAAHARGAHSRAAHARRVRPYVGPHATCTPALEAEHPRYCVLQRRHQRYEAELRRRRAALLRRKEAEKASRAAARARVAPACEDGSTPAPDAEGATSCADGAEPVCPAGAQPRISKDGTILFCVHGTEPETPFDTGQCEDAATAGCGTVGAPGQQVSACDDGSRASAGAEGEYRCADGSEPSCPTGYELTISGDGSSLVCDSSQDGAPAPSES